MLFNRLFTTIGVGALVGVLGLGGFTNALAQSRVSWKMQSAFPGSAPIIGTSGHRFTKNIRRMSDGRFEIKFFEPGALVPALECFDSVSKGAIESCWTTPGYHAGKIPALVFFSAVPFGPQYDEFLAWMKFGGGSELRDEIYAEHDLISVDVFAGHPETSGWFKREVQDFTELRGMKIRFFGMGGKVLRKLGVSTQLIAPGDIYPALERGVIDATEFATPALDINFGFYKIARYNYFPGWHQQVTLTELLMNRSAWNSLPDSFKAMIEVAAGDSLHHTYAEGAALNARALNEMLAEHGVQQRRWSDEQLAEFERLWLEVLAEESAKDSLFKKVADSYFAWRKIYRSWNDAKSINRTYLE